MKRLMRAMLIIAMLAGCGGGGESTSPQVTVPPVTVTGVASAGSLLVGTVTLKDSSNVSKQLSTSTSWDGSFSFNVSGLTPPFLLQGAGTASGNNYTLYSLAANKGNCNINPLTHLAVTMANGGQDPTGIFAAPTPSQIAAISNALPVAVADSQNKLGPLFSQVGVSPVNIITDQMTASGQGVDLLFDLVSITITNGSVSMVNKADNGIILPATSIGGGVLSGSPNTSMMTSVFTLTGSITSESGKGASGIYVWAKNATSTNTIPSDIQTDTQGNFQLFLPNGSYEFVLCSFNPRSGWWEVKGLCSTHGVTVSNASISGLTFAAPPPPPLPPPKCNPPSADALCLLGNLNMHESGI